VGAFTAADDTRLVYHDRGANERGADQRGADEPLICLPGGAMRASTYLGDLGGLSTHRRLVLLDLRGTGESAAADPSTYRCDRQVDDVEALRAHLGLDRVDLLGHSAGAALAILYALRHPARVGRLVLVTPTPRVVDVEITDEDGRELALLRRGEPWFAEAFAAFEQVWSGEATAADWAAVAPFSYGRWDDTARALIAREEVEKDPGSAAAYYAAGAFDPPAVREALAGLRTPVLLVSGGYDVGLPPRRAGQYAGLFPRAELATLAGAGHFPWLDDPEWFVATVTAFLR